MCAQVHKIGAKSAVCVCVVPDLLVQQSLQAHATSACHRPNMKDCPKDFSLFLQCRVFFFYSYCFHPVLENLEDCPQSLVDRSIREETDLWV